jgi:hypothetical protein
VDVGVGRREREGVEGGRIGVGVWGGRVAVGGGEMGVCVGARDSDLASAGVVVVVVGGGGGPIWQARSRRMASASKSSRFWRVRFILDLAMGDA